ncbi:MAG: hypothetical protein ACLFUH_01765 [Bacteroidales bacterium]
MEEKYVEKKINELTPNQFMYMKRKAQSDDWSPYARFCLQLKGFGFVNIETRERIYKYELWMMGYSSQLLLSDSYPEIRKYERNLQSDEINEFRANRLLNINKNK